MEYLATLISEPAHHVLTPAKLREVISSLPSGRFMDWLAPDAVADIAFHLQADAALSGPNDAQATLHAIRELCRDILGTLPVDVVLQPMQAHRRKRLLIADMDSTMIGQECIDELADFAGARAHVAAITERAMRGEIAFEPALRARVALLRGLPVSIIAKVIASRITLTPGARTLIATMRRDGAYTALISGGFTLFTSVIAAQIGFDEHRGNNLLAQDGYLTGEVAEPILGRQAKLAALIDLARTRNLALTTTLAVGDGANDLAMLGAAGLGIAYHAKPAVAAAAHAAITHNDLTALLFAQGYRLEAFVPG